jgi:hypothetical protein
MFYPSVEKPSTKALRVQSLPWISPELFASAPENATFGRVEALTSKMAAGWLIVKDCTEPPTVSVHYKGELVGTSICDQARPDVDRAAGSDNKALSFRQDLSSLNQVDYVDLLRDVRFVIDTNDTELSHKYANCHTYRPQQFDSPRSLTSFEPGSTPKISVIIPVYDRVQPLRESILSILHQTYNNFELILVGDAPPLDTMSVIEEFRAHPKVRTYIYPDRSGNACRGRNKGIMMATGQIVAFQDSDDFAFPRRLETAAYVFTEMCGGNVDLIYTGVRALMDGTRQIGNIQFGQELNPSILPFEDLKHTNPMFTCTVCMRRDVLLLRGGFRREMVYREDHELWLRTAYHGANFHIVPEPLSLYRIHSGNAELLFLDRDKIWLDETLKSYTKPWRSSWVA